MTEEKSKIDWKIVIAGIAALTIIEVYALSQGVNGALMTLIIGVIGLAIGVMIPNPIKK